MSDEQSEVVEFPLARSDLEINEVADGLVVFDPVNDRVHYMNESAAVVFVLSTGDKDVTAIAAQVQAAFALSAPALDETRECLRVLRSQGLLV